MDNLDKITFNNISKENFLSLSISEQEQWISENIFEFEENLYGDGFLNSSYALDEIDFHEYQDFPEDYQTASLIKSGGVDLSEKRIKQINEGADLSEQEKRCLASAISGADISLLIGHHYLKINLHGGEVFAYFTGRDAGMFGFDFAYVRSYSDMHSLMDDLPE